MFFINRKKINYIIDGVMIVLMPLLMAYALIGEVFHEIVGILIFALFIAHHILHRKWLMSIFKGKYNRYRVFSVILNLILFILMLLQPLSGIAMSKHLFVFLRLSGVTSLARTVHLCLAYWCLILMCVHLGLHISTMLRGLNNRISKDKQRTYLIITRIVITAISLYGVYAFIRRGLYNYMFLITQFAFFDYNEPRLLFFADYIAIMVLFTVLGHYIGKGLKKK